MNNRDLRVLEYNKIIEKLASFNSTRLGKEMSLNLLPESDFNRVKQIQKETTDAVEFILKKGNPPLGGINDISQHIKRVEMGAILSPMELLQIGGLLRACRILIKSIKDDRFLDDTNCLINLISSLSGNKKIEDNIEMSIENEEEVSDNASTVLFNIRRQIRSLQGSIKEKLNNIIKSSKYQKYMQDSLITMRGDRYVVPVKQEHRSEISGLIHDASASGQTVFIEPMAVVEANNEIKSLRIKEEQEIERILIKLTSDVASFLEEIKSNMTILTQIDFIVGKAKLSLELNAICPILNDVGEINIKRGRHPLIDKDKVVPIDFWLGYKFTSLVITGPNTGGKTVTLKTVGLFTLMAQSGLHVPADHGTAMSVFDNVLADIGDEQSIEQSLSTFSSHMKNIVNILDKANRSSLVLFDELGAGTDPTEGAALATGILEYLSENKIRTVATTHYSELKVYAIAKDYVENACCEFNVNTLRPTYRLLIGVPGKSNAFAISGKLGLSDYVLNKSKDFLSKDNIKFEDILHDIEENRNKAEKDKQDARIARNMVDSLRRELEEQKVKLSKQKESIIKEAKEEARKIYEEAKESTERIINELNKLKREKDELNCLREAEKIKQNFKKKSDTLEYELNRELFKKKRKTRSIDQIKVGDSVYIINLDQTGTVNKLPNKNGDVSVQVGIMHVNVNVSNLELVEAPEKKRVERMITTYKKTKSLNVTNEIDLRGFALDEALESVDKYLDDVSIAGLNEVTIIHGKGTGVLRNGIQDYLKTHPHVKSYRYGKYGEGETGVTIVEIK